MKHRFRFFASRDEAGTWALAADEWHHLIKVLRLAVGDRLELSNGQGWVATAALQSLGKHEGTFEIVEEQYSEGRAKEASLTLALGVLKPQTMDDLLPMLVELGVDEIILLPYRGMERARLQDKLLERWERIIVSAAKQCKAPWFMRLSVASSLDDFAASAKVYSNRYLMDPEGSLNFQELPQIVSGPCVVAIGSEQGFAAEECETMKNHGFELIRFEGHILRAITASVAAASLLRPKLG